MAGKVLFDADKKAQEREEGLVKIGGQEFHPRRRSVEMMDEWLKAAPESGLSAEEFEKLAEEDRLVIFRSLVQQLVVLLRDAQDKAPTEEMLRASLDVEDGFELLSLLTPDMGTEEARLGNSETADSAQVT